MAGSVNWGKKSTMKQSHAGEGGMSLPALLAKAGSA